MSPSNLEPDSSCVRTRVRVVARLSPRESLRLNREVRRQRGCLAQLETAKHEIQPEEEQEKSMDMWVWVCDRDRPRTER